MSVEAILNEVRALSVEERDQLLEKLSEEYPDSQPELSEELKALLDERVAEDDATPGVGYTIDEVIAYVKRPKK